MNGVRVTHLPTGLFADVHHERSQHKNDDLARRILAGRLWAFSVDRQLPETERLYDDHGEVRTKRVTRRYVLHPNCWVNDDNTATDE